MPFSGGGFDCVLDLVLGVVILIITGLIAKHLPAIVQLFLMEWVNISAGARYASSILMQYIVVAVGGSMFLSTVGWAWSNLQWLVAALGVGIGFGLQEIVANFISGLIMLFERPVQVLKLAPWAVLLKSLMRSPPRATSTRVTTSGTRACSCSTPPATSLLV